MKTIPRNIREIARGLRNNSTKAEIILWGIIKNEKLGMKFLRQKPIHLMNEGSGRERYIIPDFYCFEKNIIIEVDGNVHENREVAELDVEKEKLLRVQGYHVLRITNGEIVSGSEMSVTKVIAHFLSTLPFEKGVPEVRRGGIISRCAWAENASDLEKKYHDEEWGRAVHDDKVFFEFLILEGAQAGLSWSTILNKREGYRELFDNFDVEKVAKYDENKILEILENPKIVRNKLKVRSTVKNAQVFLQIQKEFGSFDIYIWSFVGGAQIKNSPKATSEVPVSTEISDTISKDLKRRGMSFVGTTIMYAFMQATGLVDDHTIDCFCYEKS